jgi:polyisoprenoid-binding protein YceI
MSTIKIWRAILVIVSGSAVSICIAEPVTYEIEPSHTYPSFEADHWHGLSIWRGKINRTSGMIVFDKEAETGSLDITMDMASIDFGHDEMNERAVNDIFHVPEYPTARYTGTLVDFKDGRPTAVEGMLTLHGVTKALDLAINHFQCQPHWKSGIEICGAAAATTLNRGDYGVTYDLENGFFPEVNLFISVEGRRLDSE